MDRLPPLFLAINPSATIDRFYQRAKSPIADWNSDTSSNFEQVSANKASSATSVNSKFFIKIVETPSGEYQDSPSQLATLAG